MEDLSHFVVGALLEVIEAADSLDRLADIGRRIARDELITHAERDAIRQLYKQRLEELQEESRVG